MDLSIFPLHFFVSIYLTLVGLLFKSSLQSCHLLLEFFGLILVLMAAHLELLDGLHELDVVLLLLKQQVGCLFVLFASQLQLGSCLRQFRLENLEFVLCFEQAVALLSRLCVDICQLFKRLLQLCLVPSNRLLESAHDLGFLFAALLHGTDSTPETVDVFLLHIFVAECLRKGSQLVLHFVYLTAGKF